MRAAKEAMTMTDTTDPMSRRSAFLGLGAGALGIAAALGAPGSALGQASTTDHPFVGCWLAMVSPAPDVPPIANVTIATADGFLINMAPVTRMGPNGLTIASGGAGRWEATDGQSAHFTSVQVLSTEDGAFVGTLTLDAYPTVSDDGTSFVDTSPDSQLTIRDPQGSVESVIPGNRDTNPLTASRIDVGAPGFPEVTLQQHVPGKAETG
jgi:hypothetical protein